MADFAPPTGPPPPRVPDGWKAVWNAQYQEYFYVNMYTKASQWDPPTEPAHHGEESGPPGYSSGPNDPMVSDNKRQFESNNPYGGGATGESDQEMAARLQREEQSRGVGHSQSGGYHDQGGSQYQQQPQYQQQYQQQYPQGGQHLEQDRGAKSGGLLGKLASKLSSKSSGGQHGHPQQGYGGGGYGQQGYGPQPGYGQGYGGHHPGMMGGPQYGRGGMMGGGYGGRGYGGGGYGQPPRRGGMGAGGAAALGVGGGLMGKF